MHKGKFYEDLAFYYDFVCEDRKVDVEILTSLIKTHKESEGTNLLDVACGTGLEDVYLKRSFQVTGIDINQGVLAIAQQRNPDLVYLQEDMKAFSIPERFDVIACFDAMGYLSTLKDLEKTLANFHQHLKKGGVLVFYIDTLLEHYQDHTTMTRKSDNPLHVTLIEDSYMRDGVNELYLIFVVREKSVSRVYYDIHNLSVFKVREIETAAKDVGFYVYLYDSGPNTFSTNKYSGKEHFPVFVCVKQE